MADSKNRRKNYFVKASFQRKFILKFCSLVVLGSAISGAILYFLSRDSVTTAFVDSRMVMVGTANYILPALLSSSIASIFLISIATTIAIMYISNRIAGPLFKIEKSVKELGEGDLRLRINLRSTDEITEMANSINGMTENFNKHLVEIKERSHNLSNLIENLKAALIKNKSASTDVQRLINDLSKQKEQLDKEINYFKL